MQKLRTSLVVLAGILAAFILFNGCSENNSMNSPEGQDDAEAVLKQMITENDEINSFTYNYNEDDGNGGGENSLAKITEDYVPLRVMQRMTLLSRNIEIEFQGDTAYGTVTNTFGGELIIAASLDSALTGDSTDVDTVLVKSFNTTMTRKIIFKNNWEDQGRKPKDNPKDAKGRPLNGWQILAFSLPEAGTEVSGVTITKITVFLPDGDSIIVTEPNDHYLYRPEGIPHQIPHLGQGEPVTVRLEMQSAYADTDYVTLTHGAVRGAMQRSKKRFELVSSEYNGQYYEKVYENIWTVNQHRGPKHAVINVLPAVTIREYSSAVEENTWGVPYRVQ